jgi:hypothetical protein
MLDKLYLILSVDDINHIYSELLREFGYHYIYFRNLLYEVFNRQEICITDNIINNIVHSNALYIINNIIHFNVDKTLCNVDPMFISPIGSKVKDNYFRNKHIDETNYSLINSESLLIDNVSINNDYELFKHDFLEQESGFFMIDHINAQVNRLLSFMVNLRLNMKSYGILFLTKLIELVTMFKDKCMPPNGKHTKAAIHNS